MKLSLILAAIIVTSFESVSAFAWNFHTIYSCTPTSLLAGQGLEIDVNVAEESSMTAGVQVISEAQTVEDITCSRAQNDSSATDVFSGVTNTGAAFSLEIGKTEVEDGTGYASVLTEDGAISNWACKPLSLD